MGAKHQNKRRGVVHEIERRPWTDAEIDTMLNELLPLDDPKKLHLTENRIAEQLDRGRVLKTVNKHYGSGRSLKPIDLALWKLASGYQRFRRYQPGARLWRTGLAWTWMEKRILRIAFDPANDAAKEKMFGDKRPAPVTVEYISLVLQRPPEEIRAGRINILKQFVEKGFGL